MIISLDADHEINWIYDYEDEYEYDVSQTESISMKVSANVWV